MTDTKTDLVLPTIHLNGTGAETLWRQYQEARYAIGNAMNLIQSMEFHPRDYHLVSGAWDKAVKQMSARLEQLQRISDEFAEIENHIEETKP
jgi:hypothetical protein